MGPLTLFLHSQLLEGSVGPFSSKIAEKEQALTPAEIHRLAQNLVSEWGMDPELHARSLALIGKTPKDRLSERDLEMMVRLLHATHSKSAEVEYHGKKFPGYNKPISSDKKDKKMMVLAKKGDQVKLVHFGQKGYQHNYSPEAKQNYLTRSAGIRDKSGNLTKDDPFSPNYWARKVLWPKGKTGEGSNGPVKTEVRVSSEKKASLFDVIAARKENEKWAAVAKLAENENFSHGAELAGLGILAIPTAASIAGHAFRSDALKRIGNNEALKHGTEAVGLGTLAAPSIAHFLKKRKAKQGA
jgi:hypothetical protein